MTDQAPRLASLREALTRQKLDGFIVPLTDEHMSEYVGTYAKRLEWLTGFQGSAGSAVVLTDAAAIFVDRRYTPVSYTHLDVYKRQHLFFGGA